jgi:hypothetical protein
VVVGVGVVEPLVAAGELLEAVLEPLWDEQPTRVNWQQSSAPSAIWKQRVVIKRLPQCGHKPCAQGGPCV